MYLVPNKPEGDKQFRPATFIGSFDLFGFKLKANAKIAGLRENLGLKVDERKLDIGDLRMIIESLTELGFDVIKTRDGKISFDEALELTEDMSQVKDLTCQLKNISLEMNSLTHYIDGGIGMKKVRPKSVMMDKLHHINESLVKLSEFKEFSQSAVQICYKSNEPCTHGCSGLCRDSM